MLMSPARSAAAVISIASPWLSASGFSQNTDLPPAISASVVGLCAPSGVELTAASNSPQAIASSSEPNANGIWKAAGEVARPLVVGVDRRDQLAAGHQREPLGMGARHRPGAEHHEPLLAGHRKPSSPGRCSEAPFWVIGSGALSTGTLGASATSRQGGAGLRAQWTAFLSTVWITGSW